MILKMFDVYLCFYQRIIVLLFNCNSDIIQCVKIIISISNPRIFFEFAKNDRQTIKPGCWSTLGNLILKIYNYEYRIER